MQQTETYKLGLIDKTDAFSPDTLNDNTRKVEEVLKEKMEGPVADLEQRVTVLEGFKFTCGRYAGTETYEGGKRVTQTIRLPFTPVAVFLKDGQENMMTSALLLKDRPTTTNAKIIENGLQVSSISAEHSVSFNDIDHIYVYIAFGSIN